jgi:hypothetical protein
MKETLRGVMSPEARCPRCREVVVYGIDLEYKNATSECAVRVCVSVCVLVTSSTPVSALRAAGGSGAARGSLSRLA